MAWLAPLLSLAGFFALAMAMERHHKSLWRRVPSQRQRRGLRALGILSLGAALVACSVPYGWASGVVLWFGLLSAAALGAILLLISLCFCAGMRSRRIQHSETRLGQGMPRPPGAD